VETGNVVTNKQNKRFIAATEKLPKTQTALNKRVRSLSFSDLFLTAEWLKRTAGTQSQTRVLAIRQELEELGLMLDSLQRQKQLLKARGRPSNEQEMAADAKGVAERAQLLTQFRERHKALNKLLSGYTFRPALAYSLDTGVWRFTTVPQNTRGAEKEISDGAITVRASEGAVIAALARLASSGRLSKLHLCDYCRERWLISERQMDRFCGAECRQAHYKEQPEYRARKARNQRNYRDQNNG
jgi:hypothetical protein